MVNSGTVACIIARTNSKRLPRKVLIDINGRPLIEHLIRRIQQVKTLSDCYLCTSWEQEDGGLKLHADRCGIEYLADDPDSVIDRMISVARLTKAENVVRITGDNIFTDPIYLSEMIRYHNAGNFDYTRTEMVPLGLTAEVIRVTALMECYKRIDPKKSEYLMLFMFRPDLYRCLVLIPEPSLRGEDYSLTVDTPADLERTLHIFNSVTTGAWVGYSDIIALHKRQPIPHLSFTATGMVKLPDGSIISYQDFRADLRSRIMNSYQFHFPEGHYESSYNTL